MKRFPSCILATCCIPWDEDHRFLEPVFRRGVRNLLAQGVRRLYIFGTAGEGYAVTERQFDQIAAAFADEMQQAQAEPMVGVIHLSLGTVIERIERCRDLGITLFQISLPAWGALNDRELFDFFDRVCGRFPDCRFLHYNLLRTKRLVTPQEYAQLAAAHPNLVATKNSSDSMSMTAGLLEHAPELQHFFTETGFLYGSLLDECGLLASLVTSWPKLHALYDAGRRRDLPAVTAFQREVRAFHQTFEFLRGSVHIDGAFDKMFVRLCDSEFPLRLLPPYAGVSEDQFRRFETNLRERLPDWLPEAT